MRADELVRPGAHARRRPAGRHLAGRGRRRTSGASAGAHRARPDVGRRRARPRWPAPTRSATRTVDLLAPTAAADYAPTAGVTYPTTWPAADLADALQDTAQLIKADLGTERRRDRLRLVGHALRLRHHRVGRHAEHDRRASPGCCRRSCATSAPLRSRVTVVTISEFGRRVKENGNRGLDHGWGNMMLLAGAGVKGGKYYGTLARPRRRQAGRRRPAGHHRLPQRARRGHHPPLPRPVARGRLPRAGLRPRPDVLTEPCS